LEKQDEDSFDDTPVFSQTVSMACVPFRYPRNDPLCSKGLTDFLLGIISPIRIQLGWLFAPFTPRRLAGRNRIHQGNRKLGVIDIDTGLDYRERYSFAIIPEMPFVRFFFEDPGDWGQFSLPKKHR
jgi:hypothetical protein